MIRPFSERVATIAAGLITVIVLAILYLPVFVSAIFSVVETERGAPRWDTFTLQRYVTLWSNESVVDALQNTIIVAFGAVTIATVVGLLLALYAHREGAIGRRTLELVIYLPFLLPPIITGLSLLIASVEAGIGRGLLLIAIGHTAFVLAVCFRLIVTRLRNLPPSLVEASADLGASPLQTFRYVLLPHLGSAILTGAILALTLSFDETLISVFLAGDTTTLPLRLWAMMRVGFTAEINALVTIVLLVSILLAIAAAAGMRPGSVRSR